MKTKQYAAILALIFICQASFAQRNVDNLFKEFSQTREVEGVKLGKFTMTLAGLFTETMGVDTIEAYAFDNCPEGVKTKLTNAIRDLKDSKFETMVTANENGNRTRVLVKIEEDMIREMVVVSTGQSNALVRIKGKIKPSDIERVVNKHGKGGC